MTMTVLALCLLFLWESFEQLLPSPASHPHPPVPPFLFKTYSTAGKVCLVMETYPLRSTEVMDIGRQPIITTLQKQHNPSLYSLYLTLYQHIHLTLIKKNSWCSIWKTSQNATTKHNEELSRSVPKSISHLWYITIPNSLGALWKGGCKYCNNQRIRHLTMNFCLQGI